MLHGDGQEKVKCIGILCVAYYALLRNVCNLLIEKHLRLVDAQLGPVVDGVGVGLHPALRLHFPYK